MKQIRVAVVGFGNVGRGAVDAVLTAPDMELAGVVEVAEAVNRVQAANPNIRVVTQIEELGKVDVAVLAAPTKLVPDLAPLILSLGISTVDSFDMHGHDLLALREKLAPICVEHGCTAISGAGWDPGTDSIVRALFEVMAPRGITYTNFGPGMSMGHTVAMKAIPGVKNALSMTIPVGQGKHRRLIYVELMPGYTLTEVEKRAKADPYFAHDECVFNAVDDVTALIDVGHGAVLERKGVAGVTHNQNFRYELRVTNPAVTGQVLVSTARAATRQKPGAYTLLEIPVIDFLPGSREDLIRRMV